MPDAIAFASVFIGATTFTGLNERQLEAIARLCIQTVVKKGERLIEQDIPVQTLNVIVSGRLVADTGQPVGDRLEAGRSDAIEEPAFFKRAGALHTWTAMRETVALALPYGEMLDCLPARRGSSCRIAGFTLCGAPVGDAPTTIAHSACPCRIRA